MAGAGFADMGNDVACADIDERKIAMLKRGEVPIYEPGLETYIERNTRENRLTFTTDVPAAVAGAQAIFLAVGTPPKPDGSADLAYILKAAESAARAMTGPSVIVTKSTVPVGTGDKIEAIIKTHAKHPCDVVSNPEFLKEGDAIADFMKPDRVIVGTSNPRAIAVMQTLYAPFTRSSDRMVIMDRRSAELTKYAANAMLATRISFMNDLANLCDRLGADIELVRKGMGSDARIGNKFLYAGPGFGGSCFPKDLRAAINTATEAGTRLEILDAVVSVNERQKHRLFEDIRAHFAGQVAGKRIAIWGLAFKPGTDDVREAPALVLAEDLVTAGATVVATDPVAIETARKVLGDRIRYAESNYDCAKGADALALLTEWREYRQPNFSRLASLMAGRALFDGRNAWSPSEVMDAGFSYSGIGRGTHRKRA